MRVNVRCKLGGLVAATLFSLSLAASAQIPDGARLPYSGDVLVARAMAKGTMQRPLRSRRSFSAIRPNTNCSPAPCVLPNVQISPPPNTTPRNGTPIVVKPGSTKIMLAGANDYACDSVTGFFTTTDGGSTWTEQCLGIAPGYIGAGDPGVAFDLAGHQYTTGVQFNSGDGADIVMAIDFGAATVVVPAFFPGGSADKDWLQADVTPASPHKNNLYISATQFDVSNNSEITVSTSTDGGATFTTVTVDALQTYPTVDQFSDIAIARNGTVYVSWIRCIAKGPTGDCGGTKATLLISKSTDGGTTWSPESTIAKVTLAPDKCGEFFGCLPHTNERVSNIPVIAVDNSTGPSRGHVYAGFYNWNGTYMVEEVARSANGGATWFAPVRVTPTSDTHDQFFNWIAVSSDGVLEVAWLDRRNDPSNISYEAFSSISTNGGTKFQANKQLSSALSNPANDGFGGSFMGDYTGSAWAGEKLYFTYCDTSNGSSCQDELAGYFDTP